MDINTGHYKVNKIIGIDNLFNNSANSYHLQKNPNLLLNYEKNQKTKDYCKYFKERLDIFNKVLDMELDR